MQHPLAWVRQAHAADYDVLLDGAAFVPANPLDPVSAGVSGLFARFLACRREVSDTR